MECEQGKLLFYRLGIYFHLLYSLKTGEVLKRQDTKCVVRLRMLARSPGTWKPYLRILTPTPTSTGYKVRFGIGIPSKLVGALVAAKWHTWTSLECLVWAPTDLVS